MNTNVLFYDCRLSGWDNQRVAETLNPYLL